MAFEALRAVASEIVKPKNVLHTYGTAGFRAEASTLPATVMRTGVIAAARSLETRSTTGLMVTASHNPPKDNGVKVSDPDGSMLPVEWELYCNNIAAAEDAEGVVRVAETLFKEKQIQLSAKRKRDIPAVFLARDTRASGRALGDAAIKGIKALGVEVKDFGILSTPQLHFLVRAANEGGNFTEQQYFDTLVAGYQSVMAGGNNANTVRSDGKALVIDAANGVGALKVKALQDSLSNVLTFDIRNDGSTGELNTKVGADFVEKQQLAPQGFDSKELLGRRCVSLDGDADRLVFFYFRNEDGKEEPAMRLLDGNKIAALAASFINEKLNALKKCGVAKDATIGVVQTAYANGSSTRYLREQGLDVQFAKTGVKHLHVVAHEFDIGIYFEANGHGTVLFRHSFVEQVKNVSTASDSSEEAREHANGMLALVQMINQAVGDALSGILLVEAILALKGWDIEEWDKQYENIPSRQSKVKVPDRTLISTADAETRAVTPEGLQDIINEIVSKYPSGRSFVRPSGTEDVVRVYSEAETQSKANELAEEVANAVRAKCC